MTYDTEQAVGEQRATLNGILIQMYELVHDRKYGEAREVGKNFTGILNGLNGSISVQQRREYERLFGNLARFDAIDNAHLRGAFGNRRVENMVERRLTRAEETLKQLTMQ